MTDEPRPAEPHPRFPEPTRRVRVGHIAARTGIYLMGAAAPVVSLLLGWYAFGLVLTFAGGTPPTPAELELSHRLAAIACVVAVGVPAVGLAVVARDRRRLPRVAFVVMLVIGVVFSACAVMVVVLPTLPERTPAADPPATSSRSVCQEHSGGGTSCPGG